MRKFGLIVITGLPGTGKTTLARDLARRYRIALLAKDSIKEPLMDVLGCAPERSRVLSDASFAVMFALAHEHLAGGLDLILEGNFRAGEHEPALLAALPPGGTSIVQVLCKLDERERQARLRNRASDSTRHPGHRDAQQTAAAASCGTFLDLPGERRVFAGGEAGDRLDL